MSNLKNWYLTIKNLLIIKAILPYFTFLVVDKLFPPEVDKKCSDLFWQIFQYWAAYAQAANRALESIFGKLIFWKVLQYMVLENSFCWTKSVMYDG